jgi:hypothetical protein
LQCVYTDWLWKIILCQINHIIIIFLHFNFLTKKLFFSDKLQQKQA